MRPMSNMSGFNIGGMNASGQVCDPIFLLFSALKSHYRSQRFLETMG